MKPIIFCSNVHSQRDVDHLVRNVEEMIQNFNVDDIFVVSNGVSELRPEGMFGYEQFPFSVNFRKFKTCDSYQLGPTNSVLNCLRFAAETVENPEDFNIIFVHPDLYVRDKKLANSFLQKLDEYDFICRNYVGPDWRGEEFRKLWEGVHYYMTEDFFMSGRILKEFLKIPYDSIESVNELPFGVHEMKFASVIDSITNKVLRIDIERNGDHEINELSFYHSHSH